MVLYVTIYGRMVPRSSLYLSDWMKKIVESRLGLLEQQKPRRVAYEMKNN